MGEPGVERVDPDELAALEEQRAFLLASLDDLDREHDFGDLDDDDYATLHADYTARAAQVLREIEDTHLILERAVPQHRGWRRVIAVVAVGLVAIVAALVVTTTSGSGENKAKADDVELVPSKATQACIDKMGALFQTDRNGTPGGNFGTDAVATIRCFSEQISTHPGDAVAYTYRGRVLGLLARQLEGVASSRDVASFAQGAARDLAKARSLAPRYPDALAFSAMAALSSGDTAGAQRYLAEIDRLQLPATNPVLPIVNNVLRPAIRAASTPSTVAPSTSVRK